MLTFVPNANPKKSGKLVEARWKPTQLQADGKWVYYNNDTDEPES